MSRKHEVLRNLGEQRDRIKDAILTRYVANIKERVDGLIANPNNQAEIRTQHILLPDLRQSLTDTTFGLIDDSGIPTLVTRERSGRHSRGKKVDKMTIRRAGIYPLDDTDFRSFGVNPLDWRNVRTDYAFQFNPRTGKVIVDPIAGVARITVRDAHLKMIGTEVTRGTFQGLQVETGLVVSERPGNDPKELRWLAERVRFSALQGIS